MHSLLYRAKRLISTNSPHRSRRRRRPPSIVPALEALEERALLSTYTVVNLDDAGAGSLRQAVEEANANIGADAIEFAGGLKGTIGLSSGELAITDDLTIDGPGAKKLTVTGSNLSRIFNISGSETDVAISGLSIADGRAAGAEALGGGILNNGAVLAITDVTLTNNRAIGDVTAQPRAGGGAIANIFGATLHVADSTFTDNESFAQRRSVGGAILNDAQSTLTIIGSTFMGNVSTGLFDPSHLQDFGGEGGALANLGESSAFVSETTFSGNQARGGDGENGQRAGYGVGGAIENSKSLLVATLGGATLTVENSLFVGNEARGGDGHDGPVGGTGGGAFSGAIDNWLESSATIRDSEFRANRAVAGRGGHSSTTASGGFGGHATGGAISNSNATMTVERSTFIQNQAISGSGGNSLGAGGNGELAQGGAFHQADHGFAPVVTFIDVTFIDNQAIGGDGGNGGDGKGGNGGMAIGGGLEFNGGTMKVLDSTLDGNRALGGAGGPGATPGHGGNALGGGIANANKSLHVAVLEVSGSLLKNNQAVGGSGIVGHADEQCPSFLDDVAPCAGLAQGGAIFSGRRWMPGSTVTTITNTTIINNQAIGADGTDHGGDAQGAGIYTDSESTLTLLGSTVKKNRALAGSGATPGTGVGGGIYIATGGTVCADAFTIITGNFASTSEDDVFGSLCLIETMN